MSENKNMDGNNEAPPEAPAQSWSTYVLPVLGAATSLAIAGLLFATFWIARPRDLRPRTEELADRLELVLTEHYVPRENITRGLPEPQTIDQGNTTTFWTAQSFMVTVPTRLNNDGLKKIITKEMSTYNVRVMDGERIAELPNSTPLVFYLDDYRFVDMMLTPTAEEIAAASRSDLRNISLQVADVVKDVLTSMKLKAPAEASPIDVVSQEDLNSFWNYSEFRVALPPGMTLGALKEKLEEALLVPDARVETMEPVSGAINMTISLGGRTCVGLACTVTRVAPPLRPQPITLDSVLRDGIQGSDPVESMIPMERPASPEEETKAPDAADVETKETMVTLDVSSIDAPVPADGTYRMAIIIDDGGYVKADSRRVLKLDPRLTLAILPNTPYGAETSAEGASLGFEIMLHMPMESHSKKEEAVEGTIFGAMGQKEIQKLVNNALDQYPEVVGINNHTGSKFTENEEKLGFVFEVLKERNLFFIDSFTLNTSIAYEAARKAGIPTARRDVFLDNNADEASIRAQFDELVKQTIAQGSAIGIGHFQKPNTAKVLAVEIPKLKNAGIELVHASELLH